jgi:hypothetical protein
VLRLEAVSTNSQAVSDNGIDPGVLLGAVADAPQYRRGERSTLIKYLHDRYPELRPFQIAKRVGCGQDHVAHVLNRYVKGVTPEELRDFQANEPDILDAFRHKTLASITDADLEKASFLQKVTGAAILLDKSRLLNGQPTSIHVTALVDLVGLLRSEQASDE